MYSKSCNVPINQILSMVTIFVSLCATTVIYNGLKDTTVQMVNTNSDYTKDMMDATKDKFIAMV